MGNLIYPKKAFLYNTMTAAKLGVYTDKDSVKKLVLKDQGIELPGGTTAKWSKSVSSPFQKKLTLLKLNRYNIPANAVSSKVEYGIRIVADYRTPGYIDNSEYWPNGKFYGGIFVPGLDVSGGLFSDANAKTMEDDIINQISLDLGMATSKDGAKVRARRAYIVTDDDNTDASGINVNLADGTTVTFVTATTFAAGQFGKQFNNTTALKSLFKAYRVDTDKYLIISIDAGYKFTIDTAVDATIVDRFIALDSRLTDIKFDVAADDGFVNKDLQYNLFDLTSSDAFLAASNIHITQDGTTVEITAGTNIATVITAINAATTSGFAVDHGGNRILFASKSTVLLTKIRKPYINAAVTAPFLSNITIDYAAVKSGQFSNLTADDVFRELNQLKHSGDLSTLVRQLTIDADAEYVKFNLKGFKSTDSIHGANHVDSYQTEIDVYIKKDAIRADIFDSSAYFSDSVASPDRTIDELLNYWKS